MCIYCGYFINAHAFGKPCGGLLTIAKSALFPAGLAIGETAILRTPPSQSVETPAKLGVQQRGGCSRNDGLADGQAGSASSLLATGGAVVGGDAEYLALARADGDCYAAPPGWLPR